MKHFEQAVLKNNYEEALDTLRNFFEQGISPLVTVPKKYSEALKRGLVKSSCWLGENIIAGTIGRDPYMPTNEERIIARIKIKSIDQVEPRLTGDDRAFHGVVAFRGPIEPDQIEVVQ